MNEFWSKSSCLIEGKVFSLILHWNRDKLVFSYVKCFFFFLFKLFLRCAMESHGKSGIVDGKSEVSNFVFPVSESVVT